MARLAIKSTLARTCPAYSKFARIEHSCQRGLREDASGHSRLGHSSIPFGQVAHLKATAGGVKKTVAQHARAKSDGFAPTKNRSEQVRGGGHRAGWGYRV